MASAASPMTTWIDIGVFRRVLMPAGAVRLVGLEVVLVDVIAVVRVGFLGVPPQVLQGVVGLVTVAMASLVPRRAWPPEGSQNYRLNRQGGLPAATAQRNQLVAQPMIHLLPDARGVVLPVGRDAGHGSNPSVVRDFIEALPADDWTPYLYCRSKRHFDSLYPAGGKSSPTASGWK